MVDQAMIERVAAAIDRADVGFNMKLTRLVDGVHTYELKMDGKVEEFDNTDDLYIRVREIKQRKQAEGVIAALSPTRAELSVGSRPAGHCDDDKAWAQLSEDYGNRTRADLCKGDLSDFALANAQFMCDRNSLDLIVYQTAAKERIRWLSTQLARALAALSSPNVAGDEALMPHEPTAEMLAAAMKSDQDGGSASMKTIWMVMWGAHYARAAPSSPMEGGE